MRTALAQYATCLATATMARESADAGWHGRRHLPAACQALPPGLVSARAANDPRLLCVADLVFKIRTGHPFADANARIMTLVLHRELTALGYHPAAMHHQLYKWSSHCHVWTELLHGLAAFAWMQAHPAAGSAWHGRGERGETWNARSFADAASRHARGL